MDGADASGARPGRHAPTVLVRPASAARGGGLQDPMTFRDRHAPLWVIWGMIAAFTVIQITAWFLAGGIPRRTGVLVQVLSAWVVMLILAALATRRIGSMAERIREQQSTHAETLGEIE